MIRKTFIVLLSLISVYAEAKIVRVVTAHFKEEKINGYTFMYRLDVVDGRKKEQWAINGQSIAQADYDTKILEAEMEERRKEREQEYQKQIRLAELRSDMANQAVKKLLVSTLQEIEQGLAQIDRYELNPYLVYGRNSFADELDFSTLKDQTVPEIRQLLTEEFDSNQAKEKLHSIQWYPQRLASLFEATVQNAISSCDDPKKLKNWLHMLS